MAKQPIPTPSINAGKRRAFAQRIRVNDAVVADSSILVAYNTTPATDVGDPTRPLDLIERLTNDIRSYAADVGIGSSSAPFQGSIDAFARRVVDYQASQAANAENAVSSFQIIRDTLQAQYDADAGVDIDTELTDLLVLETAYSANARVMTTVQELMQIMLNIGR